MNYNYLIYVRKINPYNGEALFAVYGVETEDIFHSLGEFIYRSLEQIEYITFTKATEEKITYWEKEKQAILPFENKYYGKEV